MTTTGFISWLYALSGGVGVALYIPQLVRLRRSREARLGLSLVTWGGWSIMGAISALYAVTVVGTAEMIVVTVGNAAGIVAILAVGVAARLSD